MIFLGLFPQKMKGKKKDEEEEGGKEDEVTLVLVSIIEIGQLGVIYICKATVQDPYTLKKSAKSSKNC